MISSVHDFKETMDGAKKLLFGGEMQKNLFHR
jgi:hypothetical protein